MKSQLPQQNWRRVVTLASGAIFTTGSVIHYFVDFTAAAAFQRVLNRIGHGRAYAGEYQLVALRELHVREEQGTLTIEPST
jgi:hypothetical protein